MQVVHGARLGTNLIELVGLDLDDLALHLADQHGLDPAMEVDFDQAESRLRESLPPELAARWLCVPLCLMDVDGSQRVMVAARDPLPDQAIDEIQTALGIAVTPAIASELRIFYYLESFYGFERPNRFKRIRREESIELPIFFDDDEADDLGDEEDDLELEPASGATESSGTHRARERRHFVRPLSEVDENGEPSREVLARIRIRRASGQFVGVRDPGADLSDVADAIKAVKRATGRDKVGDIVIEALRHGFDRQFEVAMILVVREHLAVGWKGFVRGGTDGLVELVAIPLAEATTTVAAAYQASTEYVGPPAEGSAVEGRLWTALEVLAPAQIAVIPIELFGDTVCLLYVHSRGSAMAPAHLDDLRQLGEAVTSSFERLTRAAQR